MIFRKDINGLRALAVLPVLFFHAEWEWFSGGFLGVDVFFVISGFLITSIIFRDLDAETFSILSFYDRRARRILPALLLTCCITTALSFIFMLPYDLKNYGQSLVASILSANNILLYLTSGYWSLAAEFKPLYHTWSLAVEEQFYLIIPALILAIYAFSKPKLTWILLVLSGLLIASFISALLGKDSEFVFLIVTHRMWELLIGSLVAILMIKNDVKKSGFLASFGLVMILFSYFMPYAFSTNQAIYNLIPVIGTLLIIIFSSDELFIGKILSVKPLFIIGLLSYSIYLFHLPILAFLRLSLEGRPSMATQLVLVLFSIPLAYLSWEFIEKKFRNKKRVSNKAFYSSVLGVSIALLSIGLLLHKSYGLQQYAKYSYGNNPQQYADFPLTFKETAFSNANKKNLLIVGNSFARDFTNMMIENNVGERYEIIYLDDIYSNALISKKLMTAADLIITVSSNGMSGQVNEDSIVRSSKVLLEFLKDNSNGNFVRIGTKNFGHNNNFVKRKSKTELLNYEVNVNNSNLIANNIEKSLWGERYIDLIATISNNGSKVPLFTPNNNFISFDTNHVTKEGAIYLGKQLLLNSKLGKYITNTNN